MGPPGYLGQMGSMGSPGGPPLSPHLLAAGGGFPGQLGAAPPAQLGGGMPGGVPPQGGTPGANGGPSQPLTMVAPASAFSGEAGKYPWYRVSFVGGVDLRHGPSVEAPRTGEMLCQNATFASAEELLGADQRVYLRLADGRGWAFDDTALFPHDPSVVRGFWQPISMAPAGSQHGQQQPQAQPGQQLLHQP